MSEEEKPQNFDQNDPEEDLVALDAYVQMPVDVFPTKAKRRFRSFHAIWALVMLVIYLLGLGSGYGLWGLPTPEEQAAHRQETAMADIMAQ